MISARETAKIRREMRGLEYYSIPTEILTELLYEYEKQHPEARPLHLVEPPPAPKTKAKE